MGNRPNSRFPGSSEVYSSGIYTFTSRALHWLWIIYFREEDNIDVQPILHCQHGILEQVFGKFQLGSVIDLNDTDKSVIVAEVNNKTNKRTPKLA